MTLIEYIKRNYRNPNRVILKNLGANEKLIAYLFETPWNTNVNVLKRLITNDSDSDLTAIVGTAIVGISQIGE